MRTRKFALSRNKTTTSSIKSIRLSKSIKQKKPSSTIMTITQSNPQPLSQSTKNIRPMSSLFRY
jgi:hypothetical protein